MSWRAFGGYRQLYCYIYIYIIQFFDLIGPVICLTERHQTQTVIRPHIEEHLLPTLTDEVRKQGHLNNMAKISRNDVVFTYILDYFITGRQWRIKNVSFIT